MTKQEKINELINEVSGPKKLVDFDKYTDGESREAILELSGDKDSIIAKRELVELICKMLDGEIRGEGCWDVLCCIKYNGPFDHSDEADKRRNEAYEEINKTRQKFKEGLQKIELEYAEMGEPN